MMTRAIVRRFAAGVLAGIVTAGCEFLDPVRPTPHADTEIFGNLMEVARDSRRDGDWIVKIQVGVPRALGRSDQGYPTPQVSGGILAVVTVTPNTVVTVGDRPAALDDISPGSELTVVPVPGSTTMLGEKEIHLEAEHLMDFSTYARWRLPKLDLGDEVPATVDDASRINSSGIEHAPVPVGNGFVLYFSARLRPVIEPEGRWTGAARDGLHAPGQGQRSFERSYRTELEGGRWSKPELVVIPGIEGAEEVQVTWVSQDETACFATVRNTGGTPWVGRAQRARATDPWGEIIRLEALGGGDAFDAIAMIGGAERIVFATTRNTGSDLFLHQPEMEMAQPLQPEINTEGLEWAPRVGPANELYFVRDGRQLRFQNGRVSEVRPQGPHRMVLVEAAPSADGRWLFFSVPRYRPIDVDLDIQVAPLDEEGSVGSPISVDDWRPD